MDLFGFKIVLISITTIMDFISKVFLFLIYIGSNYIQEYILPIGFIKLWSEVSEFVVYRRLKLVEVADQKVVFSF